MTIADDMADTVTTAVQRYLVDNGGGIVTGLACVVTYIDQDRDRAWATVQADGQMAEQTLGMLRFYTIAVERDVAAYFDGLDDEDE